MQSWMTIATQMSYQELRKKVLNVLANGIACSIPHLARVLVGITLVHKIVKHKADDLTWIRLVNKQLFGERQQGVDVEKKNANINYDSQGNTAGSLSLILIYLSGN